MRDEIESTASVPLERPVKTSPTTGSTGAPQPTTLHGPVESPRTLANAPTTPPLFVAEARQPEEKRAERGATAGGGDPPPRGRDRAADPPHHVISREQSSRRNDYR